MKNTLKLIPIVLLGLMTTGCISTRTELPKTTFNMPSVPLEREVETEVLEKGSVLEDNGLFIKEADAKNFLKNERELENYVQKLMILLKTIEDSSNIEIKGEWYK